MTIEELLKRLQEFHEISVDKKTPYNYAKYGWIPAPKVINKGRAGGKMIDYEESASVEFVASYRLKREKKVSKEMVTAARRVAKEGVCSEWLVNRPDFLDIVQLSAEWDGLKKQAMESEDPMLKSYNQEVKKLYNDGAEKLVASLLHKSIQIGEEHSRQMQEFSDVAAEQNLSTQDYEAIVAKMKRATEEFTIKHDAIMAQIKAIFNETEARARSSIYGPTE